VTTGPDHASGRSRQTSLWSQLSSLPLSEDVAPSDDALVVDESSSVSVPDSVFSPGPPPVVDPRDVLVVVEPVPPVPDVLVSTLPLVEAVSRPIGPEGEKQAVANTDKERHKLLCIAAMVAAAPAYRN